MQTIETGEGMHLLCSHTRGDQRVTLEQVDGVGITSYILTHTEVRTLVRKEYVRRTLRRGLLRRTILVVPVLRRSEEPRVLTCEVFTRSGSAFRAFERLAARTI